MQRKAQRHVTTDDLHRHELYRLIKMILVFLQDRERIWRP